jgi:acetolactate synthase I/II/III large subunit
VSAILSTAAPDVSTSGPCMMKLSDYVMDFLADAGVTHVFEVTGGGAMHLNDSLGRSTRLQYVCNLHEQASSMAAETYGKVRGDIGACLVTTGPGGTNAVTGCAGAWLDSTPCFFVSGQVKRADLKGDTGVRQIGVQEVDIVAIVRPITKYAVTVLDPDTIRYHLEKALYLARNGRPGPVWVDLPLDVQGISVDVDTLTGFDPAELEVEPTDSPEDVRASVAKVIAALNRSERPILLVGNGVRLARGEAEFLAAVELLGIPVLTTWLTHDLIPDTHMLFVGRPGPVAPRGANFALQNSDFLLSVGARLDNVVTGYAPQNFARAATKVMVDVDRAELRKMRDTVQVPVCADARSFLVELLSQARAIQPRNRSSWMTRCAEWKERYPVVLPEYRTLSDRVSTYVLTDVLSDEMAEGDIIVSGSSGAGIEIFLLALRVKARQRVLITTALGAMGYGLPATIGACIAAGGHRTICVDGDGGLMMNIQEFETLRRLELPVKIFVLNNGGYSSIRTSQMRYFGRLAGADASSGVTLPDLERVVRAFGLSFARIENQHNLAQEIRAVLSRPGPVICEVMVPLDEPRAPSLSSMRRPDGSMVSKPLEDLWPFLERDEFLSNMIIPPLDE